MARECGCGEGWAAGWADTGHAGHGERFSLDFAAGVLEARRYSDIQTSRIRLRPTSFQWRSISFFNIHLPMVIRSGQFIKLSSI
jgi:hypothetical protein